MKIITCIIAGIALITALGVSQETPNPPMTTSGTMERKGGNGKERIYNIDMTFCDRHVSGSFGLADARGQTLSNWCVTPRDVVLVGRQNLTKNALLTPNSIYGFRTNCYATGFLFFDGELYKGRVHFISIDPVTKVRSLSTVKGSVLPKKQDGTSTLFDVHFTWNDELFGPRLTGSITKSGDVVSYSFSSRNMDEKLFHDFSNWWIHCIAPNM